MLEVEKPADMKAHIGEKIGSSEWVLVDQAMIDKFAEVRFTAPVPAGSRVRLHQTLKSVEDIDGGVRMTFDSQIEVEGSSRPALVAETMGLAFD